MQKSTGHQEQTRKRAELEDQIYLQMDKLLALCGMQSIADANDCEVPVGLRTNYSVVLEEQAQNLRELLNEMFEGSRPHM